MNKEQAMNQSPEARKSQAELQNRYGRIALSAVAAALPYGADSKKPAETKTEARN
ncbi:MAG: hypothetical protein ABW198_13085 [Pseudorhodoplanes sp.]|jgi:hypothetical protein